MLKSPLCAHLALGLSLLTMSADAAPMQKVRPPAAPSKRVQRAEAHETSNQHDLALLLQHHERVTKDRDPNAAALDLTNGTGDELVTLDPHGNVAISQGEPLRPAKPSELARLQLATAPQFGSSLRRLLVRTAGLTGDPHEPSVVEKAKPARTCNRCGSSETKTLRSPSSRNTSAS